MAFGGTPPATGKTENWNGTSWSEVADLTTARDGLGGAGTNSLGLAFGGGDAVPVKNATEEWSEPVITIREFTLS